MWISRCSRFVLPALRRSSSSLAVQCVRGRGGAPQLSVSFRMQQRHGQHTHSSASLAEPGQSVRYVGALHAERLLQVEWEEGGHSLYPFTWLRDNCQCPRCTLQSALARKLLVGDLDVNIGVDSVELTSDNKVSVVWQDQHSSVFDCDWLKRRCFSAAARRAVQEELFLNGSLITVAPLLLQRLAVLAVLAVLAALCGPLRHNAVVMCNITAHVYSVCDKAVTHSLCHALIPFLNYDTYSASSATLSQEESAYNCIRRRVAFQNHLY